METEYLDNYEDLYDEQDISKHSKLVKKVLSLNKTQHLEKPSRTEPTIHISEYDLVKSITGNKGTVEINELTKSLKDRKSRIKLRENVKKLQSKSRTLPKPLEKPQASKIRRAVAYEKTRLELDRWEATVTSNRASTNLCFPLNNDYKLEKKEREEFPKMWRVKSKLQEELDKIQPKVETYDINLEQEKFPLTMKEMLARRREAAKLRAFQGYQEAKARRQNKIKSKKYHRILKKERIKKQLKEFELLQKTNPEEALKKIEEIERSRVRERFSLRHKSTGKWAQNQQIRAKYDKESRQNLAQQLALSRDLTQKVKPNESDSDEEIADTPIIVDESNPWTNIKPDKEVSDFVNGYRKFWIEQNESKATENVTEEENEEENENPLQTEDHTKAEVITNRQPHEETKANEPITNKKTKSKKKTKTSKSSEAKVTKKKKDTKLSTSDWTVISVEDGIDLDVLCHKAEKNLQKKAERKATKLKEKLSLKKEKKKTDKKKPKKVESKLALPNQKKRPQIDEALDETTTNTPNVPELEKLKQVLSTNTTPQETNIDAHKFLEVKKTNLSTAIPDILTNESDSDEENGQKAAIVEAFEDDDLIDEFNKDKEEEIGKNAPKKIDLSLPGWGSWGGENIKQNKRKKARFTIKPPPKVPRRDDNKGFLIINDKAQSKVKEHLVSEVPFPFKTVKDFEASTRAPVGNTFLPETAFRKLIQPTVKTRMGTIIEPMSKEILINKSL